MPRYIVLFATGGLSLTLSLSLVAVLLINGYGRPPFLSDQSRRVVVVGVLLCFALFFCLSMLAIDAAASFQPIKQREAPEAAPPVASSKEVRMEFNKLVEEILQRKRAKAGKSAFRGICLGMEMLGFRAEANKDGKCVSFFDGDIFVVATTLWNDGMLSAKANADRSIHSCEPRVFLPLLAEYIADALLAMEGRR